MFIFPPHDVTGPGPLQKPDPNMYDRYVEYWLVDEERWHDCDSDWLRPGIIWRYEVVEKPKDDVLELAAQLYKPENKPTEGR